MSERINEAAFPVVHPDGMGVQYYGLSMRDYFAAKAPIDFDTVVLTYGCNPNLHNDMERAAFFAVWALLRHEYADAMLAERDKEVSR